MATGSSRTLLCFRAGDQRRTALGRRPPMASLHPRQRPEAASFAPPMKRTIETDYLVVGCGAAGMAFTDALVADSDADVVIVDRRHAPGGHWHDAYPFVRLHQDAPGAGLGLSLAVSCMEAHGGRVEIGVGARSVRKRASTCVPFEVDHAVEQDLQP